MPGSRELTSGSSVRRSQSGLPLGRARGSERGRCQLLPALESHQERLGDGKNHPPPPFHWRHWGPESRIHAQVSAFIVSVLSMAAWSVVGQGDEAGGKNLNGKMGRKRVFLEGSPGPRSGRRASCRFKGSFLLMATWAMDCFHLYLYHLVHSRQGSTVWKRSLA